MGQHNNKKKTNGLVGAKIGGGAGLPKEKEKQNGLIGLKTQGRVGQPKEKRENEWISRGLKQGAGQANLRKKKRKQMD